MAYLQSFAELEDETQASIKAQDLRQDQPDVRRCGCQHHRDKGSIWLCQYHKGFEDGVMAVVG